MLRVPRMALFSSTNLVKVNPYKPTVPKTLEFQDAANRVTIKPTSGTLGTDSTIVYQLPMGGCIQEISLAMSLAPATGTGAAYCGFPALQLIKDLTIECGGNTVIQILDYTKFLSAIFTADFSQKHRDQLFSLAGTSAGGDWITCPIFTPWSSFFNARPGEIVQPLPTTNLRGIVTVTLNMNSPTSLLIGGTGTAGALSGSMIVDRSFHRESNVGYDWLVKSCVVKTGPVLSFSAGVSQRVTLSHLSGELKQLYVYNNATSADVDAFAGLAIPSSTQFFLNADQINDPITPAEQGIQIMQYKRDYQPVTTDGIGDALTWDPSFYTSSLRNCIGTLTLGGNSFMEAQITTTANANVCLIGLNHCWFSLDKGTGMIRRQESGS